MFWGGTRVDSVGSELTRTSYAEGVRVDSVESWCRWVLSVETVFHFLDTKA